MAKQLMQQLNLTRDLFLLDLYHKKLVFYFSPSSTYLNALSTSIVLNLYLNKKISIDSVTKEIKVIDNTSICTYNKAMLDYIEDYHITKLNDLADKLFLDTDFTIDLFEKVVAELEEEKIIKVTSEKRLVLFKNTVELVNREDVKKAYDGLYQTLYKDEQATEFVALALLIDSFFNIDNYFSKDNHQQIKERLDALKGSDLYDDIKVFRNVIEDFYYLSATNSTNFFGQ